MLLDRSLSKQIVKPIFVSVLMYLDSWEKGQDRHEHYLAPRADIKSGMKILDVACGIGCPTSGIAVFTGAYITRIKIHQPLVERAKRQAKACYLTDEVESVDGNFIVG